MIYRLSILTALAVMLGGCKLGSKDAGSTRPTQSARDVRIAQLEDELHSRDKQIEDLRSRADQLAGQAKKLEFLNEQLTKQLDAVADAPRQRDRYRQQVAVKQLEIDRLRRQIKELKRALGMPTSQPTSTPITKPD